MANPLPISEEQLRAAFTRESPHRPHWPRDFLIAINDPLIRRTLEAFVRGSVPTYARRKAPRAGGVLTRQGSLEATDDRATTDEPGRSGRLPWQGPHLAPGEVDRKRAASGDRDDD